MNLQEPLPKSAARSGNRKKTADVVLHYAAVAVTWLLILGSYTALMALAFKMWGCLFTPPKPFADAKDFWQSIVSAFWSAASATFAGLAAGMAALVAIQQQRWRKREELAKAKVVAAGIAPFLQGIIDTLHDLAGQLQQRDRLLARDSAYIDSLVHAIEDATLHVSVGQITDLTAISPDLARNLAQAVSIVGRIDQRVQWTIRKLGDSGVGAMQLGDPEARTWPDWADEAGSLYRAVKVVCDQIVKPTVHGIKVTRFTGFSDAPDNEPNSDVAIPRDDDKP